MQISKENGDSFLGKTHIVSFMLRDLVVILMVLIPVLTFLIGSYYSNERRHALQEAVNLQVETRLTVLESHYTSMMMQHAEILAKLELMKENELEMESSLKKFLNR